MKFLVFVMLFMSTGMCVSLAQCSNTCGANLLMNPGFETPTASCSSADIQLYNSQSPVANWLGTDDYPGAGSSPDYFSPCAGITNNANNVCISGSARVGVFTKTSFGLGREYVQSPLITPLQAGKTYCFSMVVKSKVGAAGNLLSSCDGMGAWFHNQGLINIQTMNGGNQFLGAGSTINATPQVANPSGNLIGAACVSVTGTFCAQGGESWIVIGNFNNDANTQMSGSNPANYMYIDDVALFELCDPTIDLTASNFSINCGENTTLTTITTFPAGTSYTWISPAGNNLAGLGPHVVTPITSTTYTLVANYTNSCGIQTDTSLVDIIVGPCGIGAILNDTVICNGSCHDLQAYNLQGGTTPYSVQWTDATGTILGNTTGPYSVCPAANALYYFNVIDAVGNTFADSLFIQVNNYPVVNVGNDTTICSGELAQLVGTATIGVDQWLSIGFGAVFQVSPLATTAYIYQSDNSGCVGSDTVLVTVNPLPIIDLQSTGITCFGLSNGSATAVVTGVGPFDYNWYPTTGANAATITGLPAGWEWLEVTDVSGCSAIDSVFFQQPTALQLTVSGDSVVCLGESTTLTANVSGGTSPYSIDWNNGAANGTSYFVTPASNTTIGCTVTDANGCEHASTINLQVNPLPIASFNGGIQLCAGADTVIQNTSIGATNYSWSVNGQSAGTTTDLVFNETNTGCYAIQLIAENLFQCSDTAYQLCAVEIQPNPISNVHPTTYLVFIDEPNTILFNNSTNGDSCIWYLDGNWFHTGCDPTLGYTFPDLGSYQFSHFIYNDFGCQDSSIFKVEVREGLIYYVPNAFTPDGDEFNNIFLPIFTSGFDPFDFRLEIFNRWGELIFESKDATVGWDGSYSGKTSMNGSYTWKITFKDLYVDKRYEMSGTVTLFN